MNITIKQIADLSGVSRGTVDRVLNNRGKVKQEVVERVQKIAKELNYSPNLVATALKRQSKEIKIGVIYPDQNYDLFFAAIAMGVNNAKNEFAGYGVELKTQVMNNTGESEWIKAIEELEKEDVDAIVTLGVDSIEVRKKINGLVEMGIPVITFNQDVGNCKRLCFVGQDHIKSGEVSAELMARMLKGMGKVLIINGPKGALGLRQRAEGFSQKAQKCYPNLDIDTVIGYEDYDKIYEISINALKHGIDGIFITSRGNESVIKALEDLNMAGKKALICYNLFDASASKLENGTVSFSIGQGAVHQGYLPIKLMVEYLLMNKLPKQKFYHTGIDIQVFGNHMDSGSL